MALLLLAGCSRQVRPGDIAGRTYRYEKDGVGGPFTIQLEEDGTFTFHEGSLSSYIGVGTWTLEGNTLCITDEGAGRAGKITFGQMRKPSPSKQKAPRIFCTGR